MTEVVFQNMFSGCNSVNVLQATEGGRRQDQTIAKFPVMFIYKDELFPCQSGCANGT